MEKAVRYDLAMQESCLIALAHVSNRVINALKRFSFHDINQMIVWRLSNTKIDDQNHFPGIGPGSVRDWKETRHA